MTLPVPPIEPMLAKIADELPQGEDGFRAIVFRSGDEVHIQSRDLRPLNRYFPELEAALTKALPKGCVIDGEIVVVTGSGLDFDALQQRLHPAASRVAKLAKETPSAFVAFDLLAAGGRSIMQLPQAERRVRLERLLGQVAKPVYLTPATRDRAVASQWLQQFEGAGLDGVIAKPEAAPYQPGKRTMLKIKHARTADCVVGGFRWYRDTQDMVGSLLLGLYDDAGVLHHVGVTSAFTAPMRRQLAEELAPLRKDALANHPWRDWASVGDDTATRMPGAQSRWSAGKDLSWEPLRPERVCEVKYDHMQGDRFRHAAIFLRWRPDKPPGDCRYDQLAVATPFELEKIFKTGRQAATSRTKHDENLKS
ncbi:MAG: ATP-dependent ligase-like protein [Ramlibacter sp.]|nr:ATP-dependent ligase-like protein [Ramlibacter sp.]